MAKHVPKTQSLHMYSWISNKQTVWNKCAGLNIFKYIRYCEKNTKFENKSGRFFQIFVAFSEDLNFNGNCHFLLGLNFMKVLKSINEHFGIRVHRCHLIFFWEKNKHTHLLIRWDHRVNGNCLCLIDHYPTAYTAQCSNPQLPGIKTEEQIIDIESFITL